ncbi:MAG: penicillin-binding protein [Acidimicrobiia bacterium]|nr:MAG: penicillin-binding protein [Acidimicrobiia bacterium]
MARNGLIHQIEARERRGRWFPALAGLLVAAVVGSAWFGLFSFLTTNAAYATFERVTADYVPDVDSMALDLPDVTRTSKVYSADGALLAILHDGRISEPVPYEEIPEVVVHAVLAAEDEDFFEHEGVDFRAIASAALDAALRGNVRGGSTITQQVVKNVFVGDEFSIRRKIAEAFVSAELERRYSKEEILEYYLNTVFFGSNAYGIAAAAQEYYDKDLDELTVDEAATLAVLIRNPTLYNPRKRPGDVQARRDTVLDQMVENGWITEAQARAAKARPVEVLDRRPFKGPADHVVAEVTRQLLDMTDRTWDFLGTTREERKKAVFGCPADDAECRGGGGLRIETTIDLEAQLEANRILEEWFPLLPYEENLEACKRLFPNDSEEFLAAYAETKSCSPTGAIVTIDNATGAVVVMASGLPFDFEQFDLVVQGRRNPGSAFKPIALVAALEQGITLGTYYNGASPQRLECPYVCSEQGNIWEVSNAGAGYGIISLEQATTASVNTVYAQVALEVGPEKIVETARRMGIRNAVLEPVPSIVLGASAVSPLEMASAFSNFATNGRWAEPYVIARIYGPDGELIYEHRPEYEQVGDPRLFAAARRPLTRVPTGAGTAPRANIGRPQGGKTGTHQEFRDAWFVGFVPQYTTAVWTGFEAQQVPLRNVTIHGEHYSRVFGGSVPAPIWAEFMSWFLQDVPPEDFPDFPDSELAQYFRTPTVTVPWVVGLDVEEASRTILAAKLNVEVVEVASPEPEGIVVSQSAEPGASVRQGSTITIEVSSGTPPSAPMPNVIGSTFEQALEVFRQLEEDIGLRVTVQRQDVKAPGTPKGTVVDSFPAPGETLTYGKLVTLYVSG